APAFATHQRRRLLFVVGIALATARADGSLHARTLRIAARARAPSRSRTDPPVCGGQPGAPGALPRLRPAHVPNAAPHLCAIVPAAEVPDALARAESFSARVAPIGRSR